MENLKSTYETLFIVSCELDDEAIKGVIEKFTSVIEKNGEIESVNEWGRRKLAYPIEDRADGYYVLIVFRSEHAFPSELDRLFNIDENIMRSIIVKCNKVQPQKVQSPAE